MEKTGERYSAARAALVEKVNTSGGRTWVSEPEMSNDAIIKGTGKGWDEWCDLIEAWPGHTNGHAAIASYLVSEQGVDAWWSQGVTVGYERIVGLRLPYQRPDGTFVANKSRTIAIDARELRAMLIDDDSRRELFGGLETDLRSKPTAKALRFGVGPGVAQITMTTTSDGRTKITVDHRQLPDFADVAEWKFYWSDWLDAMRGTSSPGPSKL